MLTFTGLYFGLEIVSAQATGDPKEDFLYGEYYLSQRKYEEATPFYLSAWEMNQDNCNINYRLGFCYLKSFKNQKDAIPYLEKAVENIDLHYVEGRYKDPRAPLEAWLLLGEAYHFDNQLTKSSYAYHEYKRILGEGNKEMQEIVMKRIAGLGISYEFQREEDKLSLVNLGNSINTRFSDYNPVLSGDEKVMVYTQFWESYDRILISEKTNDSWTAPREITDEIGTAGNCYSAALSFDGSELYLVSNRQDNYDIYVSRHADNKWSKMELLEGKVNSRYRESSLSVSADGTYLYFASDRPGGEGGFDIYRARREGNEWGNVQNVGKVINTAKNEEAPHISYDGTKLYFSSNGHLTVGNMDIFVSELDGTNSWSTPENIGSPINTTSDEIFYIYFDDTKRGYLSRDLASGFGKNDIYVVQERDAFKASEGLRPNFSKTTVQYTPESSDSDGKNISESVARAPTSDKGGVTTVSPESNFGEDVIVSQENKGEYPTALIADNNSEGLSYDESTSSSHHQDGSPSAIVEPNNTPLTMDPESGTNEFGTGLATDISISSDPNLNENAGKVEGTSYENALSTETYDQSDIASNYQYSETGIEDQNKYDIQDTDYQRESISNNTTEGDSPSESVVNSSLQDASPSPVSGYSDTPASGTQQSFVSNENQPAYTNIAPSDYQVEPTNGIIVDYNQDHYTDNSQSISSDRSGGKDFSDSSPATETNLSYEYHSDNVNEANTYGYSSDGLKSLDSDHGLHTDSIPTYTIQIYALEHLRSIHKIKLAPLLVSHGNDGLYRYTYGEYLGWSKALEQLESIRNSGFPDAFIRDVSSVLNYQGNK